MEVFAIPNGVDVEEETVQVHGMLEGRRIEDPPVFGFSQMRMQPFCVRPGLTVNSKYAVKGWLEKILVPNLNHENMIVRALPWGVDDEGAGHDVLGCGIIFCSGCPI